MASNPQTQTQTPYGYQNPSTQPQIHEMSAQPQHPQALSPGPEQQMPIQHQDPASPPSYYGQAPQAEKTLPHAPYGPDHVGGPTPPAQAHGGMVYANGEPRRMVVPLDQLSSENSQDIDCPFCKKQTRTRVQEEHSSMTFVIGILLGLCCICLACVPCLAHWAQDVDWYCNSCNKRVATRPNGGQTTPCATPENRYIESQYSSGAPAHSGAPPK